MYQQQDADHYMFLGKVPTGPGAYPQNRFYAALPAQDKQEAAILVFEPRA